MTVDYDTVLMEMGECGPWQKRLFMLLWLPSATSAMAVFMFEFIAFTASHRCLVGGCDDGVSEYGGVTNYNFTVPWDQDTGQWSQCQAYTRENNQSSCQQQDFSSRSTSSCSDWKFSHDLLTSTAVEDMQMVCANEWKRNAAQTVYMGGMLVGSFPIGILSDKFGRRPLLMVTLLFLGVGGCLPYFFPADPSFYPFFVLARFISGIGHVGTFMMSFTLSLEYVGPKYRTHFGILIETPFALGGLIAMLVSLAGVRDWQLLTLVLSLPNFLLVGLLWFIPESPRWLAAKNKNKELVKVLEAGAKSNGTVFSPGDYIDETSPLEGGGEGRREATILDLMRPNKIMMRSLCMFYNWLVITLCYYGLTTVASTLTEDLYLNFSLVIFVEIPAQFFCIWVMNRWGRKPLFGCCQILAGVACILGGLAPIRWMQVTLAIIGKFGASASFFVVFVYTSELFPTEIRSTAVGASSTFARIGGMIAPLIAFLSSVWKPFPLLIMGGSSLVGGVLVFLLLPETLGEALPVTMEEAMLLGKKQRGNSAESSEQNTCTQE